MKNAYGEITQQISREGLWFLGYTLPLIAIYLYTKFILSAHSSFKDLCRERTGRTDGRTKRRLYASPFRKHKNYVLPL